ncbi:MAG: methyltransferase domain-containing protein [Candidatus Binatia bacterium]
MIERLPRGLRRWLRARQHRHRLQWPRRGSMDFGGLRRLTPVSRVVGFDRGLPIDRYYIERFLAAHADDIGGHVLEIGDDRYTRAFGGARVTRSDVLHVVGGNPKATIVADLTRADEVPSDTFDCIVCTQTLQMILDVEAALRHLARMLKPSGVLLATASGINRICRREGIDPWGEYWRFTTQSTRRLFARVFPPARVTAIAYGNVLAAVAFLHGLAAEELSREELDHDDPDFEVLVAVRAVKPEGRGAAMADPAGAS